MSRKKNLLEAFTRSDAPSAPSAGAVPPSAPLFEASARPSGGARPRPAWALALIGLVAAFVLGYVTGRGAGGEARAEESAPPLEVGAARIPPANQPRAFQERSPPDAPDAQAPPAGQRLEDSALYDPANLHSVVVAAYSNSNQDFAWATYQHLHDAGLPVFLPVASGNLVVVLVGAAPTEAELTKTRDAVRALERNGKHTYADAYLARIDKLIPRTNRQGN